MEAKKKTTKEPNLAKEVRHLSDILQARSRLQKRFLSGLFFGLGTTVGAGIVAGVVFKLLDGFGISFR